MSIAGRNDPCPCGSGKKYKRCCGFDRAAERLLELRLSAIEELARIAYRSPRLVPDCDGFDDWVGAVLAGEIALDANQGIEALGVDEPVRIVAACLELHPSEWDELSVRAGSDRDAVGALLGGAVAAGIRDHRPVGRWLVETVEETESLRDDPFEALAMCLDGEQLWDDSDGFETDRAVATIPAWLDDDAYDVHWQEVVTTVTARLATDWHARRLQRLVRRVERSLPFAGFPSASAAIAQGCAAFGEDEAVRRRLAEIMLEDMAGRETVRQLRASLAAA